MPFPSNRSAGHGFRPELWRIVTWLLLFLAIFGIFEYSLHAWQLAAHLRAGGNAASELRSLLAWDIVYLLAACVTVTVAAGALWGRRWARLALRVLAAALAVWMLVTAIQMGAQWNAIANHSAQLLGQAGGHDVDVAYAHLRRSYLVAIALKAVAVPILVWLSWRLGSVAVRARFGAR